MKIKLEYAELHTPLFLNASIGLRLRPKEKSGMILEYDTELACLLVQYNGAGAMLPSSNVASMTVDKSALPLVWINIPKVDPGTISQSSQILVTPPLHKETTTVTGKKKALSHADLHSEGE